MDERLVLPGVRVPVEVVAAFEEMEAALGAVQRRLHALGEGLQTAARLADGTPAGDRLSGAAALAAIVDFLDQVPEFREAGLSNPVEAILRELIKVAQGHASLLFQPNALPHKNEDHLFKQYLIGRAAAAMELWMKAGRSKKEAAESVANALARSGYRLTKGNGRERPPTATTISNWRDKVSGSGGGPAC